MFGIGPGEIVVIIIVALVVLGPEKLPAVARTLGRISGELRRMSTEFQRAMNTEIDPGRDDLGHPPRAGRSGPEAASENRFEDRFEAGPPDPGRAGEPAQAQAYIDESSNAVPESFANADAASRDPLAAKPATELERI